MADSIQGLIKRVLRDQYYLHLHPEMAPELEADWQLWLRVLFPNFFKYPHSREHEMFWNWGSEIERGVTPDPFLFCMFRGSGKSTHAELMNVYLLAKRVRNFGLYVCYNEDDAAGHLITIRNHLERATIAAVYPELSKPKVGKFGNKESYSMTELRLGTGQQYLAIGLHEAVRGAKTPEGYRPDIYTLDDIDSWKHSPEVVEKNFRTLTRDILATRGENPVVMFPQNKIHSNSIMAKALNGEFLYDARRTGVTKGLRSFNYVKDKNNPNKIIITDAEVTWPGYSMQRAQEDINLLGFDDFMREVQQDVDDKVMGAILEEWNEIYHVITWDEFVAGCERFGYDARPVDERGVGGIPLDWKLGHGHDWGATKGHPAGYVWIAAAGISPHYDPEGIDDCFFTYRSLALPSVDIEQEKPNNPVWLGKLVQALEGRDNEGDPKRMQFRVMSHEQPGMNSVYWNELDPPLKYSQVSTSTVGSVGGINELVTFLSVDRSRPHPFRKHPVYPEGHPDFEKTGTPIMGRPRMFVIVSKEGGELYYNEDEAKLAVRQPQDAFVDQKRLRWEAPRWHWESTLAGVEKKIPFKMHEDVMCAWRYIAVHFLPQHTRLSHEQAIEKHFEEKAPQLTIESIKGTTDVDLKLRRMQARELYIPDIATGPKVTVSPFGQKRAAPRGTLNDLFERGKGKTNARVF